MYGLKDFCCRDIKQAVCHDLSQCGWEGGKLQANTIIPLDFFSDWQHVIPSFSKKELLGSFLKSLLRDKQLNRLKFCEAQLGALTPKWILIELVDPERRTTVFC